MRSRLRAVSRETVLLPVHAWRLVSSTMLAPRCKYHPSCSQYCIEAVRRRGVAAGLMLSAWRLMRCNPWSLGGIDPVPPTGFRHAAQTDNPAPGSDRQDGWSLTRNRWHRSPRNVRPR